MSRITFGGLASGLDTNLLIDQLLELQGEPIKRKEKQIEELKVKQNAWRDVNMRLRHLRSTVGRLLDKNTFLTKQGHSSDPSVVSAAVNVKAEDAVYELEVERLATHHRVASGSHVKDLGLGVETVNQALGLEGSFKLIVENDNPGEPNGENGYNDIVISVNQNDSLVAIRNKINASEAHVEASIIDGYLVLKSTVSGEAGYMKMDHVDGQDVLDKLHLFGYPAENGQENGNGEQERSFYNESTPARDARFMINGVIVERSSNQVDDIIEGVTFLLEGVTGEFGEGAAVAIRVAADTEPAVEAFNTFVEQYNSVNDFIREKMDEDGKLQGDTTLMRVQRKLRSLISQPVQDYGRMTEDGWEQKPYYSLSSLGITTLDKEGYLQFNPERLTAAMQEDPEAVFDVLRFEIKDEYGRGTGEYGGIAVELEHYMKRLLDNTADERGRTMRAITSQEEQSIQRRIDNLYRRIERREGQLLRYEERLIREFTALERMISSMNSQSQELTRMIEQLPGFSSSSKK